MHGPSSAALPPPIRAVFMEFRAPLLPAMFRVDVRLLRRGLTAWVIFGCSADTIPTPAGSRTISMTCGSLVAASGPGLAVRTASTSLESMEPRVLRQPAMFRVHVTAQLHGPTCPAIFGSLADSVTMPPAT